MRRRCVASIQASREIEIVDIELWHNEIGIIFWYIVMKFTHYVGKVPVK